MPAYVNFSVDGPVCTIELNRPGKRNAVDRVMADELHEAFVRFERDDALRVAVFCAAGDHFCAGADMAAVGDPERRNCLESDGSGSGPMGVSRMQFSKPVIAAVQGYAVAGGLELALAADMRIAETDAIFGVFCRRWGVPLIDGGTVRLPRIIGMGRALDLILTGRAVDAQEALGMGLVNRVVERGAARSAAYELARELSAFPQRCMIADRASAYRQWNLSLQDALQQEGAHGVPIVFAEGIEGAARFSERT